MQTLTILVFKSINDDLWNRMEIPHFVRNDKLNMRHIVGRGGDSQKNFD